MYRFLSRNYSHEYLPENNTLNIRLNTYELYSLKIVSIKNKWLSVSFIKVLDNYLYL